MIIADLHVFRVDMSLTSSNALAYPSLFHAKVEITFSQISSCCNLINPTIFTWFFSPAKHLLAMGGIINDFWNLCSKSTVLLTFSYELSSLLVHQSRNLTEYRQQFKIKNVHARNALRQHAVFHIFSQTISIPFQRNQRTITTRNSYIQMIPNSSISHQVVAVNVVQISKA